MYSGFFILNIHLHLKLHYSRKIPDISFYNSYILNSYLLNIMFNSAVDLEYGCFA